MNNSKIWVRPFDILPKRQSWDSFYSAKCHDTYSKFIDEAIKNKISEKYLLELRRLFKQAIEHVIRG